MSDDVRENRAQDAAVGVVVKEKSGTDRRNRSARQGGGRWAWLVAPVAVHLIVGFVCAAGLGPAIARAQDGPGSTARGEPTVDELSRAAVALALAEPERARSFIVRARAAGWLPELRFRVFRRFARTEGLTLDDTATTTPVDVSGVDDVRYEWRATWDLSRIVFNPDELQAHAEALRMADVRHDIQSLVIRLYFERRRLLASFRRPGAAGTAGAAHDGADPRPEARSGHPSPDRSLDRRQDQSADRSRDQSQNQSQNQSQDPSQGQSQVQWQGQSEDGRGAPDGNDERRRLRVLELEAQLEALSGLRFAPPGGGSPAQVAP